MHLTAFGASHIGRVRQTNEDRFVVDPELGLLVVCDGMGGHAAGEVAAEIAIRQVHDYLRTRREALRQLATNAAGVAQIVQLVETAVQRAGKAISDTACQRPRLRGMGTTLTLLLVIGERAIVAHVGDSRLYRVRHGLVELITHDHTVQAELDRRGILVDEATRQSRMAKMLTRSLGEQPAVCIDSGELPLAEGDVLILCSDGLSHYLTDGSELAAVLRTCALRELPQRLIDLAISRGGGDNVTVVVGAAAKQVAAAQLLAAEQTTEIPLPGFSLPLPDAPTTRLHG